VAAVVEDVCDSGNIVRETILLGPPTAGKLAVGLPVFFVCTILAAIVWHSKVEPWCGKAVKEIEQLCAGRKQSDATSSSAAQESREKSESPKRNDGDCV